MGTGTRALDLVSSALPSPTPALRRAERPGRQQPSRPPPRPTAAAAPPAGVCGRRGREGAARGAPLSGPASGRGHAEPGGSVPPGGRSGCPRWLSPTGGALGDGAGSVGSRPPSPGAAVSSAPQRGPPSPQPFSKGSPGASGRAGGRGSCARRTQKDGEIKC